MDYMTLPVQGNDSADVRSMEVVSMTDLGKEPRNFSLLDLPAELWTQIGKEAIAAETRELEYATEAGKHRWPAVQPGITRLCRITRAELLPFFYQNYFAISVQADIFTARSEIKPIGRWLRAIGPENRRYVKGTVLDTSGFTEEHHVFNLRRWYKVDFVVSQIAGEGEDMGIDMDLSMGIITALCRDYRRGITFT